MNMQELRILKNAINAAVDAAEAVLKNSDCALFHADLMIGLYNAKIAVNQRMIEAQVETIETLAK